MKSAIIFSLCITTTLCIPLSSNQNSRSNLGDRLDHHDRAHWGVANRYDNNYHNVDVGLNNRLDDGRSGVGRLDNRHVDNGNRAYSLHGNHKFDVDGLNDNYGVDVRANNMYGNIRNHDRGVDNRYDNNYHNVDVGLNNRFDGDERNDNYGVDMRASNKHGNVRYDDNRYDNNYHNVDVGLNNRLDDGRNGFSRLDNRHVDNGNRAYNLHGNNRFDIDGRYDVNGFDDMYVDNMNVDARHGDRGLDNSLAKNGMRDVNRGHNYLPTSISSSTFNNMVRNFLRTREDVSEEDDSESSSS